MFDVLVYVYENYCRPDACPEHDQLTRKLSAVGFESEEIEDALTWLDGLAQGALAAAHAQSARGMRLYTSAECELLGDEAVGFISFLESSGVLTPSMREMVLDRAKAAGEAPIDLEHLKIIVLMVFWSLGEEPDALILDELSISGDHRSVH